MLYRFVNGPLEVMLVHPGGPFWKNKDDGVWSIPKGEIADGEEPLAAARREFEEELGQALPPGRPTALSPVKQNPSKTVQAWALEIDLDVSRVKSNTFRMEFPPRSGKWTDVPEVDKAGWFDIETASRKIIAGQRPLLEELLKLLSEETSG